VTVAVLDTGVDLDHPDLADKLLPGYDFVENDNVPDDVANGLDEDGDGLVDEGTGHGTHVSGVIAFTAPNAKILPLRVLNSDGTGELFDLVKGVIYAVDNGADVMNFSLSAHIDAPTFAAAVQYAIDQGVVVVAAGASDDEGMHFPASYPGVLSVGASNYCDLPAKFSLDSVAEVDIFAPGDFIFSTTSQAQHAWWSGTSMATPFVAGEAALLLEPGTCPSTCVLNFIQDESKDLKFKMKGKDGKDFKPRRIEGEKAAKKVKKLKVKYIGGEIGAAGSTMYVISEVFLPITPR
jgi:thermitase